MASKTLLRAMPTKRPELYIKYVTVSSTRHYSSPTQRRDSAAIPLQVTIPSQSDSPMYPRKTQASSPLAILPLSAVLRTYAIMALSSSPMVLKAFMAVLNRIAASQSLLFSPERNKILHWILKRTFFAQFCAGENQREITKSIAGLKSTGYSGVMLEYALELLETKAAPSPQQTAQEISTWRQGMLETISLVQPGDFVALKWSGLGAEALNLLNANKPPTPAMQAAMTEVCDLASSKNVSLAPSAELALTNIGLDNWNIALQRTYNTRPDGSSIIYTTYQTYLRSAPARLARDLAVAKEHGFNLGVKLVRGAYLHTEVKKELCRSKEETDSQYDGMVDAVLKRRYNDCVKPVGSGNDAATFPAVSLVIACHNMPSVQKAMTIRNEQIARGEERVPCAFAQLQGMADDISCELVSTANAATSDVDPPRTYKFSAWGTMTECLQFLLRRAAENQDAASRTADTRRAMGSEIRRRMRVTFGL